MSLAEMEQSWSLGCLRSCRLRLIRHSGPQMKERRRGEDLKFYEELIIVHVLVSVGKDEGEEGGGENRFEMGKEYIFNI